MVGTLTQRNQVTSKSWIVSYGWNACRNMTHSNISKIVYYSIDLLPFLPEGPLRFMSVHVLCSQDICMRDLSSKLRYFE